MRHPTETDMSDPKVFKYWSELAVQDPERFELERKEAIERVIAEAPESQQERLRRLQWRIDVERSRASNPLSACIRLNRMMLDSFYAENGFVNAINSSAASIRDILLSIQDHHVPTLQSDGDALERGKATIFSFPKKK